MSDRKILVDETLLEHLYSYAWNVSDSAKFHAGYRERALREADEVAAILDAPPLLAQPATDQPSQVRIDYDDGQDEAKTAALQEIHALGGVVISRVDLEQVVQAAASPESGIGMNTYCRLRDALEAPRGL